MKRIVVSIPLLLASCIAWGWQATGSTGRVVTMTRQMAVFSELENQLIRAQQSGDVAAVSKLLGDDFQVWKPSATGDPIPREGWKKIETQCGAKDTRLSQFATRVFGDVNLVNFRMTRHCSGAMHPQSYYVVDVWQKYGDGWKLIDRTESPVAVVSVSVKPSGKQ